MNANPFTHLTRLAVVGLTLALLGGCATTGTPRPPPLVATDITALIGEGKTPEQIMAVVKDRGAKTPNSEDIEVLRKAGASHVLIDQLLQVNQPTQWVYATPPHFSFYFGRAGYYWVDSFGWPVYPQPYWGPYHRPVRTVPKEAPRSSTPAPAAPSAPSAPTKKPIGSGARTQ